MSSGYVYVLSNPSMPGLVKIGRSIKGGHSRSKAFYQTGVPEKFVLEFELYTAEHEMVEACAHKKLERCRSNPNREFFKCEASEAIDAVLSIYLSEIVGTGTQLIDDFGYNASVDLMEIAARYDLHWVDVYDSVSHLSEFAIRKAVDEMLESRAKRRARMLAAGAPE